MTWLILVLSVIVGSFGVAGRGEWSVKMVEFSGLTYFVTIIFVFWNKGYPLGLYSLGVSVILYYLLSKIFRKIIGTDKRISNWDAAMENFNATNEMDKLLKRR